MGMPMRMRGGGLGDIQRGRTIRSTSESSADSSHTGPSGGGGGGGAKPMVYRYRALSFLEDIDEPDAQGFTVLLRAIQARNIERVQQCLDCGASVNRANNDGFTPLLVATVKNDRAIVELLLQHEHTDPTITTKRGCSALFLAAHDGLCDIVHVLLRYGADRDKSDRWGETPSDAATAQGHMHVVDFLRITRGFTPLHYAALVRDNSAIVELLRSGADPLAFPDTAEGAAATAAMGPSGLSLAAQRAAAAQLAARSARVQPTTTPSATATTRHQHGAPGSPSTMALRRLSPRRRQVLLNCPALQAMTPLDVSKVACDTFGQFHHKAFPKLDHDTIKLLDDACAPWSMWNHYLFPNEERQHIRLAMLILRRRISERHLAYKILGLTARGFFARGLPGDNAALETKNDALDKFGNAKHISFSENDRDDGRVVDALDAAATTTT